MKEETFQKNTILLTLGTIMNKGLQFFAILFYSRWLTTDEFGQFDLLYTYVSLFIPLITLSNQEAIFRLSVNEENIKTKKGYISSGLCFDLINYFVFFGVSFFVVGKHNLVLFLAFSFYLFAELLSTYLRGVLRAIKRLDIYSFALVLQTIVMFIFVFVFVFYFNKGLIGLLLGYALGTLVGDIILFLWGKISYFFQITAVSLLRIKELVRYSIPLVPNEVSWWIMNASDRQIINIFWGDMANGIFAIAHKIPALCSIVFNMFAISWQQEIVTKVERNEDTDILGVFNKLLVTLLSVCSCLLAVSFIFYFYFFDLKYFEAICYSPILIVSAVCMAIAQFLGGIQIAYKRINNIGVTTVIGALTNIFIHLALSNVLGLYAAALSTLLANLLVVILRMISVRDVFKVKIYKGTVCVFCLFIYFSVVSYINQNMYYNWINLLICIIVAGFINWNFIKRIIKRLR